MDRPSLPLNPDEYVVVPHVAVVDEFDMTDDEGNVIARIDATFLSKLVARMAERAANTGDLSPIVIGHTRENPQGSEEVDGPPLVGYATNWTVGPFFETGKLAAFADFWIMRAEVERARKYPRRSAEVWVTRHEIDPISLLGATTPARDLGLMRLSRDGSITVGAASEGDLFSTPKPTNRESKMPNDKPDEKSKDNGKPAGDPKETGANKELVGMLQQVMAAIQALADKVGSGAPPAVQSPTATDGAAPPAEGGEGGELSDDELNQLLAMYGGEGEGEEEGAKSEAEPPAKGKAEPAEAEEEDDEEEKSRKGAPKVQNSAGYPGGTNTHSPTLVKMSREAMQEELHMYRAKLARLEIKDQLRKVRETHNADIDPDDEALVNDLVILPEDARKNFIVRLSRVKAKGAPSTTLQAALTDPGSGRRRITTPEEQASVVKLARQKNIGFDEAKEQLGYA